MKKILLLSTMLPFSAALAGQNYDMSHGGPSQTQTQHQSINNFPMTTSSAIGNTGTISSTARGGMGGTGGSGGNGTGGAVSIGSVNSSSASLHPPDVSLPGLASSGQCGIVGGGPGMSLGGGGGGFLFARESPNCRNWYIALAWIQTGMATGDQELVHKGERLMANITSEAHDVYYEPTTAPVSYETPAPVPAATLPHSRPEWCYTASLGERRRHAECK